MFVGICFKLLNTGAAAEIIRSPSVFDLARSSMGGDIHATYRIVMCLCRTPGSGG